ncbi:MAG: hypothetical protein P1U56_06785 [Saprospiraceae bacterium]|nr:hypothetical protein [Saprospiraceae bacterium]
MKQVASKISDFLFNFNVKNADLISKLIIGFALLNIIVLLPDVYDLYSLDGYIQSELNDKYMYAYNPLLNWVLTPLDNLGFSNKMGLLMIIGMYIFSLFFVMIRYKPFIFSIVAWLIHVMIVNSSYYFSYGADYFITFSLFANVILHLDVILKDKKVIAALHSFVIRFMQIQLCFVYFFAGFGKMIGHDWLDGNAMWYVMNTHSPEFIQNLMPSMIDFPFILTGICWSVLFIELFYPLIVYIDKIKHAALISIVLMHVGIMFIMGLYTFGMIMILLNYIAFGHYFESFQWKRRKFKSSITPAPST